MSLVLTLDGASGGCSAGLVDEGVLVAERSLPPGRGAAAALADLVVDMLGGRTPTSISVVVGPGSFTGVRAAIALAHGIGTGAGVPVAGASLGEAIRAGASPDRPLWVASFARRGRVFLDTIDCVASVALDALPAAGRPVALAGDAAIAVASRMAARGCNVQLLSIARPGPAGIASAAARWARSPYPLYVDPPEARANPARPAPA